MEYEFSRMNLDTNKWRVTTFNQDYSKIPTYPAKFIVPKDISDAGMYTKREMEDGSAMRRARGNGM